ncbi:MAG: UDP-N-acetylglucosamine diphosphorylase/glucosamine-1-phosphate N-acetyltransferase [Deltaproteobacteria bacterium HGW-Deltaproteobacteria-14]|jgi:bifunctional UDP-N-acetylglucosamine pyrophosphorylase/glucosamine-1-phosphate N-acetyltransferase|nr:MAG: UDP-N-acetylglucosamine diphosphorylase/glucosamine-1-phosphate N-acetyltransferase [Deltaproteobacteria bacterium HGW-Deltaproteobacteria-14]
MPPRTAAIVLAAGKGTRMRSARAKVLHEVLGRPMVSWIVGAALDAGFDQVVVVVGHQGEAVATALQHDFPDAPVSFATQAEQRGTGHAVQCAMDAAAGAEVVAILSGDTPALDADTLRRLGAVRDERHAPLVVTSFEAADPTGYGRIVRDAAGAVARIVEHKDATPTERAIHEVNAGLYLCDRATLADALAHLRADNAQGELYLTDVVAHVAGRGGRVAGFTLHDPFRVAGINTRAQLAAIERELLARRLDALMDAGVTLEDAASIRVEAGVVIGEDTVLGPGVQLKGRTAIGRGCRVDAGAVLVDTGVADGAHVKPYVVAEGATIGPGAAVGPFAHLRPGTVLGRDVKIGNFVETKKAVLAAGAKASHLSYLGDCEIGAGANIGAGTITCNYDGFDKHRTVIEEGVFIGSDSQLVAPVRVGANAVVGAGTTVTRDVAPGALAVSRTPQREIAGYYDRYRKPKEAAKRRAKAAAAASDEEKG